MRRMTSSIQGVLLNLYSIKHFSVIVLPSYAMSRFLLNFQNTDIGGAKFDSDKFHIPLINFLALNGTLPEPEEYKPYSLPLWHLFGASLYKLSGGFQLLQLAQILIALATLYLFYSILTVYVTSTEAAIGCSGLAFNSYFVSASAYPTTDGLAIFSFVLFFSTVQKMITRSVNGKHIFLINIAISLSALNRQMFVYLFLIYLMIFFKQRKLFRIVLDLIPSGLLVFCCFYLFYVEYCNFPNNPECVTIGTFGSLPVVLNLSAAAFLFVIFTLPILLSRSMPFPSIVPVIILISVSTALFFLTYGNSQIARTNVQTGGGVFKFREMIGSFAGLFDVFGITACLVIIISLHHQKSTNLWMLNSVLVVWLSTLLGPVAFQRYFEPYLLVLGIMITFSMKKSIFYKHVNTFKGWAIFITVVQFCELLSSIFISV